jgi:hypothetical protein|eukprot:Stramenopile-MAST_4_protein_2062
MDPEKQTQKLLGAVRNGDIHIVKMLVDNNGANVYATDKLGRNCLHHAALSAEAGIMYYLIETKGMDVTVRDKLGLKAGHYAARNKEAFNFLTTRILFREYNSQI